MATGPARRYATGMTNPPIVPCLWFDHEAGEAADLYVRTFPGSRLVSASRYPESGDNPGGRPPGSVLTADLELAGRRFTLLNGGPHFRVGPSISFFFHAGSVDDARSLAGVLLDGGMALMPFDAYPWSPGYAWVQDRFGVSWQIFSGPRPSGTQAIVPCLMFSGPQHGRAEEAMRTWARIFPDSRVEDPARYEAGEGPKGTVKHGRFTLAGQEFTAMDSHLAHDLTFDEGVSLQIACDGQPDVDRYWAALSDGGQEGRCGWLKDRFGVSWQVIPKGFEQYVAAKDPVARGRAFQAMLQMKKLDLAVLQAAVRG